MVSYKFIEIDDSGKEHELLAMSESEYSQNLAVIQNKDIGNPEKFEAVSSFLPSDVNNAFRLLVGLEPVDT